MTAIRRNGWDAFHAKCAVDALKSALAGDDTSDIDRELATELVRWLALRPEALTRSLLSVPSDGPKVPAHLVALEQALLNEDEPRIVPRLKAAFRDPTTALIELLDDMEPADLGDRRGGPSSLVKEAIGALAELGTLAGARRLFEYLERDTEPLHEVVRQSLRRMDGIVAITLELWSIAQPYARQMLVETIVAANKQDDRILDLVAKWLDAETDPMDATIAAAAYGDRRLVPHLREALAHAIHRSDWVAREIAAVLEEQAELTSDERRRVDALF